MIDGSIDRIDREEDTIKDKKEISKWKLKKIYF